MENCGRETGITISLNKPYDLLARGVKTSKWDCCVLRLVSKFAEHSCTVIQ